MVLVAHLGRKEVSQALGEVSKAQAAILVRELAGKWQAMFQADKHRLGLIANPPGPAAAQGHCGRCWIRKPAWAAS